MFRRGLILTGGPIYTMDPELPLARGLMAFNGIIEYAGDELDLDAMGIEESRGGWLRAIDLGGRAVIPGMVAGAVDLMRAARELGNLDLVGVEDAGEFLRMLRFRLEGMPPGAWLVGRSLHRAVARELVGLRARIDRVAPRNPVLLQGRAGSWAAVNSLALRVGAGGLSEGSQAEGIERKPDGVPTGIVRGAALERLRAALPTPTPRRLEDLAQNTLRRWVSQGLTTICDIGGCEAFGVLARLARRSALALRATSTILPAELEACLASGVCSGFGDDLLRRGGLVLDLARRVSADLAERAVRAGFPLNLRAATAAQVTRGLDLIEGLGPGRLRHRLIGVRAIQREDLSRLAALNAVVSLRLDGCEHPLRETMPLEWLVGRGVRLGASPEMTGCGPTPLECLRDITDEEAGVDEQGSPSWGIRLIDALRWNCSEEIWGLGLESRLGRLAEGCCADLVILDGDPFQMDREELGVPRLLATICDGEVRYELPGWEGNR